MDRDVRRVDLWRYQRRRAGIAPACLHHTHPRGTAGNEKLGSLRIALWKDKGETGDTLFPQLIVERAQMIAVATNEKRIQEVNDYYKARRKRIAAALSDRGIEDPNPFKDLWAWYKYWGEKFSTYKERRSYINEMFQPLIDAVLGAEDLVLVAPEPTGWERVDRALVKARDRLAGARHEEDFQAVGLLCREVLISLAQAVYDPTRHKTVDGTVPSKTDAARMIEAFVGVELAGGSNEVVRSHAKAALKLALELQHHRTADFRLAALSRSDNIRRRDPRDSHRRA